MMLGIIGCSRVDAVDGQRLLSNAAGRQQNIGYTIWNRVVNCVETIAVVDTQTTC